MRLCAARAQSNIVCSRRLATLGSRPLKLIVRLRETRMRMIGSSTLIVLGAYVATALALNFGPDVQPTTHIQARQQYRGFSVHPPVSLGWFVKISEQTHERAIYRHPLSSQSHTFLASVGLFQLNKSLSTEEALIPGGFSDASRYQVLENSHETDNSRKTTCIRYSIRLKDLSAPNSPGVPLIMIDRGFVCAHPTMPGLAVRASYSERGLEQELAPEIWKDWDEFLRGVQIESSPGVPAA